MMKGGKCCGGAMIGKILVVIGALNWGLVGAFDFNLVNAILGSVSWLERLVYVLVGLAGVMLLVGCPCKKCKGKKCCGSGKCESGEKSGS
jgi:uncharacterized protein